MKLCQVRQGLKSHGWDGKCLLDAGDIYVSGNDSLVIGYPPRGRSGRLQELCVSRMRSGGVKALVSQQARSYSDEVFGRLIRVWEECER